MAKVLVAEHNPSIAAYLEVQLKKAGHAIEKVDNSLDAWRATSKANYDVLVIDIVMPGIDGFVLSQKALQENPEMQIIFVTGFAAVAMDTFATPSYAPAPITTRPFHLRDINARIRYMMGLGGFPLPVTNSAQDNNVVYANFSPKSRDTHARQ